MLNLALNQTIGSISQVKSPVNGQSDHLIFDAGVSALKVDNTHLLTPMKSSRGGDHSHRSAKKSSRHKVSSNKDDQ